MKTTKEPQCSYQLMNIIFSDKFAGTTLGDAANRNVLDLGKAANNEFFGEEVQQVFVQPNESYDKRLLQDDDVEFMINRT